MQNPSLKTIAVDFDGTIVEHAYPKIGEEMMFAFATLKELQKRGHRLILWTFRDGDLLKEAVDYCKKNGLEFYAVNNSFPDEKYDLSISRKINVDIFIDDRNIGGFPGWSNVWQMLYPNGERFEHVLKFPNEHHNFKNQEKKGFFSKLFSTK